MSRGSVASKLATTASKQRQQVPSIITEADLRLRAATAKVAPSAIRSAATQRLLVQLRDALYKEENAIGIAAPQIGVSQKICLIACDRLAQSPDFDVEARSEASTLNLINPRVTKRSDDEMWMHEGCLSIPGVHAAVRRHHSIDVEFHDERGRSRTLSAYGFISGLIQHEVDHLEGVLMTDRAEKSMMSSSYFGFYMTVLSRVKLCETGSLLVHKA